MHPKRARRGKIHDAADNGRMPRIRKVRTRTDVKGCSQMNKCGNEIHNPHAIMAVSVLLQHPYGCCDDHAVANATRHNPQIVQVGTLRVCDANKSDERPNIKEFYERSTIAE